MLEDLHDYTQTAEISMRRSDGGSSATLLFFIPDTLGIIPMTSFWKHREGSYVWKPVMLKLIKAW